MMTWAELECQTAHTCGYLKPSIPVSVCFVHVHASVLNDSYQNTFTPSITGSVPVDSNRRCCRSRTACVQSKSCSRDHSFRSGWLTFNWCLLIRTFIFISDKYVWWVSRFRTRIENFIELICWLRKRKVRKQICFEQVVSLCVSQM